MEWYAVQYADDPAADNVFGRQALKPRRNPALQAWLRSGGTLNDFIGAGFLAARSYSGSEQVGTPSAHRRSDPS